MELKQTALYAKGFYQKNDLFEDLKKTLHADGYFPEYKNDVIRIFARELTPVLIGNAGSVDFVLNLLSDLHPNNSTRIGYNMQGNINYNYEDAVIYMFLSKLRYLSAREIGDVEPDYKMLPKWNEE